MWKDNIFGFDRNSAVRFSAQDPLNQGLCVPFAREDAFRSTWLKEEV